MDKTVTVLLGAVRVCAREVRGSQESYQMLQRIMAMKWGGVDEI